MPAKVVLNLVLKIVRGIFNLLQVKKALNLF